MQIDATEPDVHISVSNCVFHGSEIHGVEIGGAMDTNFGRVILRNNLFTSNGGYGILNDTPASEAGAIIEDNNGFYSNTSGEVNGITQGHHDVTLEDDPYTDVANNDYTTNDTIGGGSACRDTGAGYAG